MYPIILMAETGSDITPELALKYGIHMVPMHVAFDSETKNDGSFPPEDIRSFYQKTGRLPKTSGSMPDDFEKAFDEVHEKYPDGKILYLAYSAVTTCSYQSAQIAGEGRDYVTAIDTRQVSVGQAAVVVAVAEALKKNPEMTIEEAADMARELIDRARMCFVPDNLEFLRAGGRVSNATYLGSRILHIHPCIEIREGRLMATKRYRGRMGKLAARLIHEYAEEYKLDRERLWIVYTVGLKDEIKEIAGQAAAECGFKEVIWIQAGGVITTHGGPGAFGIAGFSERR